MGFLWFLIGTILFGNVMAGAAFVFLGRRAVKAGRQLAGEVRKRRELKGAHISDPQPAQDVVVEPVEDVPVPEQEWTRGKNRRPKAPEGAEHQSAPRTTAASQPTANQQNQQDYVRLDIDRGTTNKDIVAVMRNYVSDEVLGERAAAVIDTLGSAEHRRRSLFAELDGTFQPNTISWDKFAGPAYAALDAILRNSAQLGNRIQAFDSVGYMRLRKSIAEEEAEIESRRSETRTRRWQLFCEMLESLDALQETNEGLLLELDKLSAELSTISGSDSTDRSDQIIQEISRLVDEAKYYRQIGR